MNDLPIHQQLTDLLIKMIGQVSKLNAAKQSQWKQMDLK